VFGLVNDVVVEGWGRGRVYK